MMGYLGADTSDKTKRIHFITGASSGIGAAVAAMLYARGDELWLLARSDETHVADFGPLGEVRVTFAV